MRWRQPGCLRRHVETSTAGLTILVTARHRLADIERAGRAIAQAARATASCLDGDMEHAQIRHAVCRTRIG